ncbi:hypothetical protein [Capnocytophaga bilenii]
MNKQFFSTIFLFFAYLPLTFRLPSAYPSSHTRLCQLADFSSLNLRSTFAYPSLNLRSRFALVDFSFFQLAN